MDDRSITRPASRVENDREENIIKIDSKEFGKQRENKKKNDSQ